MRRQVALNRAQTDLTDLTVLRSPSRTTACRGVVRALRLGSVAYAAGLRPADTGRRGLDGQQLAGW